MASIFAIKSRIKGVESTRKITKSMKLVSTSKLHQTQNRLSAFRRYSDNCTRALRLVLQGASGDFPLLAQREPRRVCYVVIVGNRGLCGSYNQDLLHYFQSCLQSETGEFLTVFCGRWGTDEQQDKQYHVLRRFDAMGDVPDAEESGRLAQYLRELFLSGQADKVLLLYQKHKGLSQNPDSFQLLPVVQEGDSVSRQWIFEPDKKTLIDRLSQMYMDCSLLRVLLEARASEHFARMTAMTAATDNADELMRDLSLLLNRTRQAKITTEISEVVGGAKALDN